MKHKIFVTFIESRKETVMPILEAYLTALEEPALEGSDAYMATIEATPYEWRKIRKALFVA